VQQLRQLGDVRRDPSRLIFGENLKPISQMHRLGKGTDMNPDTVTLIIWLIAGIAGGSAVGDLLKGFDLIMKASLDDASEANFVA
jgi:hypothetical protein